MKYRRLIIYTMLFLAVFITKINAQETRTLTLNEAIELSIKNSKQIKLNQARIDEAIAATKQATQARLPGASLSGS